MRVLLLSAYDTPSHRHWCEGLQSQLTDIDWTYLSLPGRYFSWRIRGNALTWAVRERQRLDQPYDVVLATSMTDLATLRGLVPSLAAIPAVLYFHENQFAYPRSASAHASVEPQMVTLYSAISAELLLFNSDYNRQTFLSGVRQLLSKLPDEVPAGVVQSLANKAHVLPVPVQPVAGECVKAAQLPLQLVWNHRWEYDKGPECLLASLQELPADCALRVHVVGQQFRRQPPEFSSIRQLLLSRNWQGQWGHMAEREEYLQLLGQCHGVLSTAVHDFQGLAVLEAVAAGCVPLVPDTLAYPEWFGRRACYALSAGQSLAEAIHGLYIALAEGTVPTAPDIRHLSWQALLPRYRQALNNVSAGWVPLAHGQSGASAFTAGGWYGESGR